MDFQEDEIDYIQYLVEQRLNTIRELLSNADTHEIDVIDLKEELFTATLLKLKMES